MWVKDGAPRARVRWLRPERDSSRLHGAQPAKNTPNDLNTRGGGGASVGRWGFRTGVQTLSPDAAAFAPSRRPSPSFETRCPLAGAVRPAHQLATERHYANGGGLPLSLARRWLNRLALGPCCLF